MVRGSPRSATSGLVLAIGSALGFATIAFAGDAPTAAITPTPLKWPQAMRFDDYQCFQADKKGHVFYFRGDQWAVYPVSDIGEPGAASALHLSAPIDGSIRDAAMDPSGESWLVITRSARVFKKGKESATEPLPLVPFAGAFLDGEPVVAVRSVVVGSGSLAKQWLAQGPPWLVTWNGTEWRPLAPRRATPPGSVGDNNEDAFSLPMAFFVSVPKGLLAAFRYTRRLEVIDNRGRARVVVAADRDEAVRVPEADAEKRMLEKMKAAGMDPSQAKITYARRVQDAILGVAVRSDGVWFFVVSPAVTKKGLELERYDPTLGVVRAARLALGHDGPLSLACGKRGLFLAADEGPDKRWFVPWDTVEAADWQEVPELHVTSQEQP